MTPGVEAWVVLPPRQRSTRCRLFRVEPDGSLTFVEPRTGGLRTVPASCVTRWHTDQQLATRKQRKAAS